MTTLIVTGPPKMDAPNTEYVIVFETFETSQGGHPLVGSLDGVDDHEIRGGTRGFYNPWLGWLLGVAIQGDGRHQGGRMLRLVAEYCSVNDGAKDKFGDVPRVTDDAKQSEAAFVAWLQAVGAEAKKNDRFTVAVFV